MSLSEENSIQELSAGLTFERVSEGKISIFLLSDGSRETIDALTDTFVSMVTDWTVEQPFLSMYVVSGFSLLSVSPYLRKRSEDMVAALPKDIFGRTALVIDKRIALAQVFNLFFRAISRKSMEYRIFSDKEDALEWLRELI